MKNGNKGQIVIAPYIIIIAVILLVGAGIYYYLVYLQSGIYQTNPNLVNTPTVLPLGTELLQVSSTTKLGQFLVDNNGKTLYYRINDSANTSNCSGSCSTTWPPLISSAPTQSASVTGNVSTTTRSDGQSQVTYNGWPLYYFFGDKNMGDTNGQGVNNIWYVVSSDIAPAASPTPSGGLPIINASALTTNTNTPYSY